MWLGRLEIARAHRRVQTPSREAQPGAYAGRQLLVAFPPSGIS